MLVLMTLMIKPSLVDYLLCYGADVDMKSKSNERRTSTYLNNFPAGESGRTINKIWS